MKLGIKVGLLGNPQYDLQNTHPDFCEIWFHSGKIDRYDNLFKIIKNSGCEVGLHYWGVLPDGTQTNISYPDQEILKQSLILIKKTVDVAAKNHCVYVNVHPGEARLTKVDFEREFFEPYTPPQPLEACQIVLQESLLELAEFSKNRGVTLCAESVPLHAPGTPWHDPESRKKPVKMVQIPVAIVEKIISTPIDNLYFTNDFSHTAGNLETADRRVLFQFIYDIARRLAPKTRLLHVGYSIPPYNGTDYHGNLYDPEFETPAAVPNHQEIKQLLELFVDRPDIYALVEPKKDHVGNFQTLKKLVSELQ